jgi:hypothetical protein
MSDIRARIADALRENDLGRYAVDIVDVLLSLPGIAIIELPTVAHKGPNDTDASAFRGAAERLDGGYSPGGSNVKRAISQLLRAAANAAEPPC